MQLTNGSFLDSRLSFMQSAANRQKVVQRITSGSNEPKIRVPFLPR